MLAEHVEHDRLGPATTRGMLAPRMNPLARAASRSRHACLIGLVTAMGCSSANRAPTPAEVHAPVARPAARVVEQVAPTPKSGDPYELEGIARRVEKTVAPQVGRGRNVGAVVGIRFRGETKVLSFGELRVGSGVAPDAHTVFEIGSVTKTFTGLLLADAIENGRVKATDRLDSFRPEWKGAATSDIRLIDLVTHRSGLPRLPCNLHASDPRRPYADYSEDDLVGGLSDRAFGKSCALGRHPSDQFAYSNWGFGLLGYVLSRASKSTYPELLRARVTEPLALKDTTYDLSEDQRRRLAQGYTEDGTESPLWDRKILMGNGAIRSTVTDLLQYGSAYLHPEKNAPLEPALLRAMTMQHEGTEGRIAYAWMLTPTGSLWHNGMTGGYSSLMKVYRTRDLVVVVLSNTARDIKCVISAVEDLACAP